MAEKLTKVSNKYKIIIHKCLNNGINEYIMIMSFMRHSYSLLGRSPQNISHFELRRFPELLTLLREEFSSLLFHDDAQSFWKTRKLTLFILSARGLRSVRTECSFLGRSEISLDNPQRAA